MNNFLFSNSTANTSLPTTVSASVQVWKSINQLYFCLFISFNVAIAIVATSLNILIIITFLKKTSLQASPSNILVLGLAISDLGVGIIAQPIYIVRLLAEANSDVALYRNIEPLWLVIGTIPLSASFTLLTSISLDRFLAVHLHLRYQELVTNVKYYITIILIGIFSAVLGIGRWLFKTKEFYIALFVLLIPPLTINSYCIFQVSRVIHRHAQQIQTQQSSSVQFMDMRTYKKSINTMYFVVGAYVFCYIPYFVTIFYNSFKSRPCFQPDLFMWYLCNTGSTFVMLNSVLNPIIYCLRLQELRSATSSTAAMVFQTIQQMLGWCKLPFMSA